MAKKAGEGLQKEGGRRRRHEREGGQQTEGDDKEETASLGIEGVACISGKRREQASLQASYGSLAF